MGVYYGREVREFVRHVLFVWYGVAEEKNEQEKGNSKRINNECVLVGNDRLVLMMVRWE